MRVTPAGSFEPLGGMTLETIPEEADADEEQPTDSLDELGSDGDPD
jgi:hypothetical protein